jgi:cytochrome o ubiquinol oxidase subunit 2
MPEWSHSVLLEIIWWTIPCIIISILAYITWFSSHNLDPYKPLDSKLKPVVIQAVALRWKWLFIYPEHNIATINFVQIPVNTPVTFLITAEGPMNSLQIPQLAGQIYAMAGMQSKLHIMAQAPGEYRGISANFSGQGFSDMKFTVRAGSKDEFDRWVLQAKQSPELLTYGVYSKLTQPSINEAVKYFVSSRDDIFQTVAMQPMMPAKTTGNLCKPVLASR